MSELTLFDSLHAGGLVFICCWAGLYWLANRHWIAGVICFIYALCIMVETIKQAENGFKWWRGQP